MSTLGNESQVYQRPIYKDGVSINLLSSCQDFFKVDLENGMKFINEEEMGAGVLMMQVCMRDHLVVPREVERGLPYLISSAYVIHPSANPDFSPPKHWLSQPREAHHALFPPNTPATT
ncbi:hypothetical protein E2P81_ATG00647 [Venturia nashicola]|uniref:Uncharacterized protein n=1 Tax=Venturia nashicola TaxID=86259 RepID=A0A4Z1PXG4_9PEZI|nr:hypothetical protein E6O75_ATG00659 [Venturia nashicola]TLD39660.1 hypothetical protein E2P81_ATG00647 [Venturia nashicola]